MNKYLRFFLFALPAIFCMFGIFRLSAQTAAQSSETSSTLIHEILLRVDPEFADESTEKQENKVASLQFTVRKGAHFSLYALLAVLLLPAFYQIAPSFFTACGFSFFCTILYAVSDEVHQSFVPGRSCELRDVLIDTCGALTGLLLLFLLRQCYRYYCRKRST